MRPFIFKTHNPAQTLSFSPLCNIPKLPSPYFLHFPTLYLASSLPLP